MEGFRKLLYCCCINIAIVFTCAGQNTPQPNTAIPILQLLGDTGTVRLPKGYRPIDRINPNAMVVQKGNNFQIAYPETQKILPTIWENIKVLTDSTLIVEKNKKIGVANILGNTIVPVEWDAITPWANNMILVEKNKKFGLLTVQNQSIIPPQYDQIAVFDEGLFVVTLGNKKGILDSKGNWQLPLSFETIECYLGDTCVGISGATIPPTYSYFVREYNRDNTLPVSLKSVQRPDNNPPNDYIKLQKVEQPIILPDPPASPTDQLLPSSLNEIGAIVTLFPDTMAINELTTVSIRIAQASQKNTLNQGSPYPNNPEQPIDIRIGLEMEAKLIDSDNRFDIQPLSNSIQNIEDKGFTQWEWDVKPLFTGTYELKIIITITKDINGTQLTKSIPAFAQKVFIQSITPPPSATNSYSLPLLAGLSAAAALLLGMGIWFWQKRKKTTQVLQTPEVFWQAATAKHPKTILLLYDDNTADTEWAERCYNYLISVTKNSHITIWYEKLLLAGEEREAFIQKHLKRADVLLLLLSADFLAADNAESFMQQALQQAGRGAKIFNVLLRKCHWQISPVATLPTLPLNQRAIVSEWSSPDEAIYTVVEELKYQLNQPNSVL